MIVHICDRPGCDTRAVYLVAYDPAQDPQEVCPDDVQWLMPFAIASGGRLSVAYLDLVHGSGAPP